MNKLLRIVRISTWGIFLASLLTCYVRWPQHEAHSLAYLITQHLNRTTFFYTLLLLFCLLQLLFYLLTIRYPKSNPQGKRMHNLMNGFVISVNISLALLVWNLSYSLNITFSFLYLCALGLCLLAMMACGSYFIYLSFVYGWNHSASS